MAGVVECLKVVTAVKSYRIAKFAFDYATRFGRKKVNLSDTCIIHTSKNVCKSQAADSENIYIEVRRAEGRFFFLNQSYYLGGKKPQHLRAFCHWRSN